MWRRCRSGTSRGEPVAPSSPACCHDADPGAGSTGLAVANDAGWDCGSPYIHPAFVPTAYVATLPAGGVTWDGVKNPPEVTVAVMSVPLNPYVSCAVTPAADASMSRTVVEPGAAFSRVVGRTPFSRGWSSIGHHQPGPSW